MTKPALQTHLPLALPARRPLLPISIAMATLDLSEDAVLALIENGHLAWAWDIASRDAKRREIRILRESLACLAYEQQQPIQEAAAIIDSFLPHFGPDIRSTHLQRIFLASQAHVQNLIDQKLLDGLNDPHTGPNGFVRVTRDSVLNFLLNRRIA